MALPEQVVVGTVATVSAANFTVTTGAGETVTVRKQPSTAYWKTGSLAPASAVIRGVRVAVLGTSAGPAISAAAVAVLPAYVWS
jgi:hypothetical protein